LTLVSSAQVMAHQSSRSMIGRRMTILQSSNHTDSIFFHEPVSHNPQAHRRLVTDVSAPLYLCGVTPKRMLEFLGTGKRRRLTSISTSYSPKPHSKCLRSAFSITPWRRYNWRVLMNSIFLRAIENESSCDALSLSLSLSLQGDEKTYLLHSFLCRPCGNTVSYLHHLICNPQTLPPLATSASASSCSFRCRELVTLGMTFPHERPCRALLQNSR